MIKVPKSDNYTYAFLKCLIIASNTPSILISSVAALESGPYMRKHKRYSFVKKVHKSFKFSDLRYVQDDII